MRYNLVTTTTTTLTNTDIHTSAASHYGRYWATFRDQDLTCNNIWYNQENWNVQLKYLIIILKDKVSQFVSRRGQCVVDISVDHSGEDTIATFSLSMPTSYKHNKSCSCQLTIKLGQNIFKIFLRTGEKRVKYFLLVIGRWWWCVWWMHGDIVNSNTTYINTYHHHNATDTESFILLHCFLLDIGNIFYFNMCVDIF